MAPRAGLLQHPPMKAQINPGLSLSLDDKWGSRHLGRIDQFRNYWHHLLDGKLFNFPNWPTRDAAAEVRRMTRPKIYGGQ
jgi:hypothetical protein